MTKKLLTALKLLLKWRMQQVKVLLKYPIS
nr:MAG TPA: hypothetical protein [Caudoviricetes sp.]